MQIKLCFKLGKKATETYGMLQTAFRPSCMNRASVFESHKRFKEGMESVRDDEKCGWIQALLTLIFDFNHLFTYSFQVLLFNISHPFY